ncbi:MAG TPA: zinc ABC transporter substrate-binding protein [Candidatus Aquabacterium excrementipullorum]|nr:zinc ABC transporter substrate-binding protein [Candidatus Aquabacterium excrementipullorum]
MKTRFTTILAGLALAATLPAHAALKVFACEPEWAALTKELAGDQATLYTATNALQDPHQIQAKPSLISAVRNADLLVCTGAELEVGWLPVLLRQSGNAKVQPGQAGNFEAAGFVRMLEVPTRLDRADGDVHAQGNPHINTAPSTFAAVAPALAKRLAELDSANAAHYQQRLADFQTRWTQASQRWAQAAAPLKGTRIVVQHKGFPYLEQWLGLDEVTTLEPKPGVEPSSTYLSTVLQQLQQRPAKLIVRAAYNDGRSSEWLSERAKLPVAVLPFTVGGSDRAKDLFGLFDDTVDKLLKAAK